MSPLSSRSILTASSLLVAGLILVLDPLLLGPVQTAFTALWAGSFLLLDRIVRSADPRPSATWGLALMAVCLVSAARSGYVWNGLQYGLMAGGVFGFWLLWRGLEPRRSDSLYAWFYALVVLVLVLPVLLQYLRQLSAFGTYGWLHFPNGPLRNPNVMARYLGLSGLFLLVARSSPRPVRWAALPVIGLCVWTGSRGGILALGISLGVYACQRYRPRWSWRVWTGIGLAGFLAVLVLVGNPASMTNLQRVQLVPESLSLWLERPLTGVGGWNFGLAYPGVSADARWQRHPHSLPLLILTEFGLLGIVFAGLVLLRWYRGGVRSEGWPLVVFLVVHELVDTMVWIPGVLLLSMPALAWAASPSDPSGPPRSRSPSLARVSLAGVLVGLALLVGGIDVMVSRGIRAAGQGEWARAKRHLWDHVTGVGSAHRALAARRTGEHRRAVASLVESVRRNSYDPYYPYLLGDLLDRRGRFRWAVRARRAARRRDPHDMLRMRRGEERERSRDALTDTEPFRPGRLLDQPHRPRWYLPLVDRNIRRGNTGRALEQLWLLGAFDKVSASTRAGIVARRIRSYRIRGDTDAARRWKRVLSRLRATRDRVRPQFHRFFYRRPGHDHALLE